MGFSLGSSLPQKQEEGHGLSKDTNRKAACLHFFFGPVGEIGCSNLVIVITSCCSLSQKGTYYQHLCDIVTISVWLFLKVDSVSICWKYLPSHQSGIVSLHMGHAACATPMCFGIFRTRKKALQSTGHLRCQALWFSVTWFPPRWVSFKVRETLPHFQWLWEEKVTCSYSKKKCVLHLHGSW